MPNTPFPSKKKMCAANLSIEQSTQDGRMRAARTWIMACALVCAHHFVQAQNTTSGDDQATQKTAATTASQVIRVPREVEQKAALRFSRLRTLLRDGDPIGEIKTGASCGSITRLSMNPRTEQAVMSPMLRVVRDELSRAGYRDPQVQSKLFEEDSDPKVPDLLLGGMLEEFRTSYCSTDSGARTDGTLRTKIHWEVYDQAQRKVVYGKTVEGTYETHGAEAMREGDFFAMAYRDALRKVLADQQFYDAVISAPGGGQVKPATAAEKPDKLVLKRAVPLNDALSKNMTMTRAGVVTVSHAGGSGSGFFVSENGYVITNSHVVGSNRFVRVILATGRELVGEVIQRDIGRDVALIKTEGSNFPALAVNDDDLNIGSEVIAIGSPLGEVLSGTVTRGVVSAYRMISGRRYIQSDVSILPGSSGGPLLDRSGRVVGIAVMILGNTRISFFVPIQEALVSVRVTLSGP